MRAAIWMAAASIGSWALFAPMLDRATAVAALVGLAGPLAGAAVSWVLAERTYRRDPGGLTALMIAAFGAKMVFFAIYVTAAVALATVRPVPFVASFTGYFIALHMSESLLLRRLFSGGSK
jgi:hypothetical protein